MEQQQANKDTRPAFLETLELKEPTPSIAPSIYENLSYGKKWRVVLALGIGICLIGVFLLAFYLNAEARSDDRQNKHIKAYNDSSTFPPLESHTRWRHLPEGSCITFNAAKCPSGYEKIPLIVIGFQGLMPGQINRKVTPALHEITRCGVNVSSLIPVYPTQKINNMYTIVTGLHSSSHGILGNRMFDPITNSPFSDEDNTAYDPRWWKGEPIWNTLSKHNKKCTALYWPGSDVRIDEKYPTDWKKYDKTVRFSQMIPEINQWIISAADKRPDLILVSVSELKEVAGKFGPDSPEAQSTLEELDAGIDQLMTLLYRLELGHCVNLVILSDHGIVASKDGCSLFLEEFLGEDFHADQLFTGTIGRIGFTKTQDGQKEKQKVLKKLQCQDTRLRALDTSQVPKRYHYAGEKEMDFIILDTKPGFKTATEDDKACKKGASGYDHLDPAMQATFLAMGPHFKINYVTGAVRNVEIYNLLCDILSVLPAPNNGTKGSLTHLLKRPYRSPIASPVVEYLQEEVKPLTRRQRSAVGEEIDSKQCYCDISQIQFTSTTTTTTESTTTTAMLHLEPAINASSESVQQTSEDRYAETEGGKAPSTDEKSPGSSSSAAESPSAVATDSTKSEQRDSESVSVIAYDGTDKSASVDTDGPQAVKRHIRSLEADIVIGKGTIDVIEEDEETKHDRIKTHCPLNCPKFVAPEIDSDICNILLHSSYIIGLAEALTLPLWVSFTLTKEKLEVLEQYTPSLPEGVHFKPQQTLRQHKVPQGCWVADPRLERSSSDQCERTFQQDLYQSKNASLRQLYPEELEEPSHLAFEGFLLSNMAPMLKSYERSGRQLMLSYLRQITMKFGVINVVHGPVFDYDFNGVRDNVHDIRSRVKPLISTGYFFVFLRCNETEISKSLTCADKNLESLSFVLPNTIFDEGCLMKDSEYLSYHLTGIKDIETLTGLRFFSSLEDSTYIKIRSHQPMKLWSVV